MRHLSKRTRSAILLASVSFALSLALYASQILNGFELKAYDLLSKKLNPEVASSSIVVVRIDQASLDSLRDEGIAWPWPRQVYAAIIEYLSEAEAIFIDLLFLEPSSYGHRDDIMMAEAMRKASNVYLPLSLTNRKEGLTDDERGFLGQIALGQQIPAERTFRSSLLPVAPLRSLARGVGNVTITPDEDGVYRRVPLVFRVDDYTVGHFILPCLIGKGIVSVRGGELYSGDTKIPLTGDRLLLRYSRSTTPFASVPAVAILKACADSEASREPLIKREDFRGKAVFIGPTAAGLFDLKPTSLSPLSTGVEIHATTFENIINRKFISPVNPSLVVAFMLIICFSVSFAVMKCHTIAANSAVFLIASGVTVAIPSASFSHGFYLEVIPPVLSLVLAFGITAAYSYAAEARERRFVRRVFSQYMDDKIVLHILRHPEIIRPGGQRRFMTIFFLDIAGFTSLAEKLTPEKTASLLHIVLDEFTEVIIRNGGVIDKYIGDSIMAFWGAPLKTDREETDACRAALHCITGLKAIDARLGSEGLPGISVRIGVHSGEVIVGNLGSTRLFDYTVVGDVVNLASRLESANKLFKTNIIVSGETLARTKGSFLARELGMIEVKGKSEPLRIFELIGETETAPKERREEIDLFTRGIGLFQEGRLREARAAFADVLRLSPDDGPSAFYRDRCDHLLEHPPLTEQWQIIKMVEK